MQFHDHDLVNAVERALADTALPAGRLELEITEGVLLTDEKRTIETLGAFRALGIRIAMDDFGTGFSSLSYLRRFPFDRIKIDQSFVQQLPHDAESGHRAGDHYDERMSGNLDHPRGCGNG